jgi:hypothetical protein
VSLSLAELAQLEYKRRKKVTCWTLQFVLHSLSMNPLPSTLVIKNCLSIIAVDLDCDISASGTSPLDDRYVYPSQISTSLTYKQGKNRYSLVADNAESGSHCW